MRARLLIGGLGLLVGVYGAWLLLSRQDLDQLTSAAIWVVAGIVLHDAVLAPLVIVLVAIGTRVVPAGFRAPAAVGLVVLGAVTILAIPVLGGFGARPDNRTLLDRDYTVGWLVVAALVVAWVLAAGLVLRARGDRGQRGRRT